MRDPTEFTHDIESQVHQLLNITKAALNSAKAENKRLRADIGCLRQSRAQIRAEMKEECARVADTWASVSSNSRDAELIGALAAAIRALKDKP